MRRHKVNPGPTKTPSEKEVAFAAGFYEGEGCAQHANKNRVNALQVIIGQKDPEILYRLREWFGGGIYQRTNSGANKITLHVLMISGNRARAFLRQVWPYLSIRRKAQILKACPILASESVTTARLPFSEERLMIQSELHGNMQSSAETSEPIN
jgi:hypothetical protein